MASIQHPYHPQSLDLPGFVPLTLSQGYILSVFGSAALAVLLLTWFFTGRYKHVSKLERIILCWWVLSGLIHVFVEGYFVFTPDFYKLTTFGAELWKEYSKADSRYVGRDPAVVAVEGITAVLEGPLCFYVVYAVLYRKAFRHTLQIAVCLGQIYGCIVYYTTPLLEGKSYSLPTFVHFWLYYVALNNIWVVVPALIAGRAWIQINKAVDEATSSTKSSKTLKQR